MLPPINMNRSRMSYWDAGKNYLHGFSDFLNPLYIPSKKVEGENVILFTWRIFISILYLNRREKTYVM